MSRHPDLADARESLEYWERRERALPRRARAKRREAREHVERWRQRVAQVEREAYGRGATGALVQYVNEGRLPEPFRQTGRRVARHGKRAIVAVTAMAFTFALVMLAVFVAIVVSVF